MRHRSRVVAIAVAAFALASLARADDAPEWPVAFLLLLQDVDGVAPSGTSYESAHPLGWEQSSAAALVPQGADASWDSELWCNAPGFDTPFALAYLGNP